MYSLARLTLGSAALALLLDAAPARAATSLLEDVDVVPGGAPADDLGALSGGTPCPSLRHHRPPPVEMTLPGYLWSKLRDEAHAAADVTAYALITATSKLAVIAARDNRAAQEAAAHRAPAAAPRSDCDRRPRA